MSFLIRWLPAFGFIAILGIVGFALRWQIKREKTRAPRLRLEEGRTGSSSATNAPSTAVK